MFSKILIFILGMGIGILVMVYNRLLVKIVGTNSTAERYLGGGGTYLMWQLIGFLVVIITILYVFGGLEKVASWFGGLFGLGG